MVEQLTFSKVCVASSYSICLQPGEMVESFSESPTLLFTFQFPEETCVDDTDKFYWGCSSNDSSSSVCSEIENAFHPIKPTPVSSRIKTAISNPATLDSFSTPTAFSSSLPLATLLSLSRPTATSLSSPSLFPSLPAYSESPVSPLSLQGDTISNLVKQSSLRIIKGPSFGSVSSDNHSEESEHFFYI